MFLLPDDHKYQLALDSQPAIKQANKGSVLTGTYRNIIILLSILVFSKPKMLGLTAGYSPACLKVYALIGVKAAFFHASTIREQKWAAKFKGNGYGCSSGEKEYRNYLKKRRRAFAKKDLLKWRTCEITIRNFDELFWSGGCGSFSKQQNQQCGGGRRHQQQQKFEEHNQEDVGHKKQKRRNQGQSSQEASKKEAQKDPSQDLWHKLNSSYSQWWGFSGFFNENFEEFRFPGERSSSSGSYGNSSGGKKNSRIERTIGTPSDRQALGLSPTGSLTMEELKKAFRSSALKWHPDRHAGDAKAVAEAKFKDCGAAYKALLNAFAKA